MPHHKKTHFIRYAASGGLDQHADPVSLIRTITVCMRILWTMALWRRTLKTHFLVAHIIFHVYNDISSISQSDGLLKKMKLLMCVCKNFFIMNHFIHSTKEHEVLATVNTVHMHLGVNILIWSYNIFLPSFKEENFERRVMKKKCSYTEC